MKWSAQTTRNVLNEAVHGYISDAMLVAAAKAVADGYDGSLLRQASARRVSGIASYLGVASYVPPRMGLHSKSMLLMIGAKANSFHQQIGSYLLREFVKVV